MPVVHTCDFHHLFLLLSPFSSSMAFSLFSLSCSVLHCFPSLFLLGSPFLSWLHSVTQESVWSGEFTHCYFIMPFWYSIWRASWDICFVLVQKQEKPEDLSSIESCEYIWWVLLVVLQYMYAISLSSSSFPLVYNSPSLPPLPICWKKVFIVIQFSEKLVGLWMDIVCWCVCELADVL